MSAVGGLEQLVGEIRTLLRDWTQYNDATLVTLMQDLLAAYGQFDDADYDAAAERRATFNKDVPESDRAYDGWSSEPQKRDLTAREREIVYRIIRDALRGFAPPPAPPCGCDEASLTGELAGLLGDGEVRVTVSASELDTLKTIAFVINARHD